MPSARAAALALLLAAISAALLPACGPDTDLFDEPRGKRPSSDAGAAPAAAGAPAQDPAGGAAPPELRQLSLAVSGACLRLRVESSKAVNASLMLRAGPALLTRELGRGASLFDVAFLPEGLPAGEMATATVTASDAQGQSVEGEAPLVRIPPPPPLPLVISELMPNPAGAEATQEFVEILNRGDSAVSLAAVALEDERGRDVLPAVQLLAGGRALLVPAGFDAGSALDVPPGPQALLIRVSGRLGSDGLRQTGEAVRLLAADGTLLSSYGGWIDTTRGAWQGKSVQRLPDEGACDHPLSWSMAPLPPTPGW